MLIKQKDIKLKDGTPLQLRSPKVEDAEALLAHLRIVFREAYRNMNRPPDFFEKLPVEEERKILADFAASDSKFMISAFANDKIVGNLGCFGVVGEFHKHTARIGMDVDKSLRGKGLGEALLRCAIDSARENGFLRLELNVRAFNEAGIKLYEKVGFLLVGKLKRVAFIDGQYHDEYIYELLF